MFCSKCGIEIKNSTNFCPNCGSKIILDNEKSFESNLQENPHCQNNEDFQKEATFQQTRIVFSVITMIFTFFILFQSCAVGLGNTLVENLELGGSAGAILCICWWVAGILNISGRKAPKYAKNAAISYTIAGIVGLCLAGSFSDLRIYSTASFIFAIVCYLASKQVEIKG